MCKVDGNKNAILSVRLDKDSYRDLVLAARESGATVSDVMREALLLYFNNEEGKKNGKK